jgi:uncharacterized protein YndB with AHSA1/START domain
MNATAEGERPGAYELCITRTFAAPVSLVYRLWAERGHMLRWWGPKEFTCTSLEMDFRPGGTWRACIESAQYGQSWMGGRYVEIEKERRLVFTFAWEDGRDQPGVDTLVTVTFAEQGARTLQTFRQAPFVHREARDSHVGGWNSAFDCEAAYAAELDGVPR